VLLEGLVTNLVRNAIGDNVEGGSVLVAVGDDPTLVVENTGGGIPSESVGGLFEPFRRGTSDRTHHGGGAAWVSRSCGRSPMRTTAAFSRGPAARWAAGRGHAAL
jgi:light-regulated signal transduction histidine kinase (bacteriophytochrome)